MFLYFKKSGYGKRVVNSQKMRICNMLRLIVVNTTVQGDLFYILTSYSFLSGYKRSIFIAKDNL